MYEKKYPVYESKKSEREQPIGGYNNRVREEEKALYAPHEFVVLSNSTGNLDLHLMSAEDRVKLEKEYANYYSASGKTQVVYVMGAGNDGYAKDKMHHNGIHYHENTLVVGAADEHTREDAYGRKLNIYTLESYSSVAPSVVGPIAPQGAERYREDSGKNSRFNGTSAATPRLAGSTVYPLLMTYAVSKSQPGKVLNAQDTLVAIRETAQPLFVTEGRDINGFFKSELNKNDVVGERYQSEQAGPGIAQPTAAFDLLKAREAYAKAHPESVKPLVDKIYTLEPKRHEKNKQGKFEYNVNIDADVLANVITLDLNAKEFHEKRGERKTSGSTGRQKPYAIISKPEREAGNRIYASACGRVLDHACPR